MYIVRYTTVFFCILFSCFQLNGQAIEISIDQKQGNKGDNVCIKFSAKGFENVGTVEFKIYYDPSVLGNPKNGTTCANGQSHVPAQGQVSFNEDKGIGTYIYSDVDGWSIPDDCHFLEICFDLIGQVGDHTPITVSTSNEFGDVDGNIIPYTVTQSGRVRITSSDLTCRSGRCNSSFSNGNDGSFYFWATGGTQPYTYTIDGVAGSETITEFQEISRTDLSSGTYNIIVTDADNNTCSQSVRIRNRSEYPLVSSVSIDQELSCFYRSDATIKVDPITSGISSYDYAWSTGAFNTDVLSRVGIGTYTVTVTDAIGCRSTNTIDVDIDTLKVAATLDNLPSCNGATDGTITLNANGGTVQNDGAYRFKLKPINNTKAGPFFTKNGSPSTYTNIPNGTYEYSVIDNAWNNCVVTDTFTFDVTDPGFEVDITYDSDPCLGEDTKVIFTPTVPSSGSDGYIADSLKDANGVSYDIAGNRNMAMTVDKLSPGTYTYYTHLANAGCYMDTTFTIAKSTAISITEDINAPNCLTPTGSITLNATGGTPPFSYSWRDDATIMSSSRTDLGAGTYVYTISDNTSCSKTDSIIFTDPSQIQLTINATQQVSCHNGDDGALEVKVNGSSTYTYKWILDTDTIGRSEQISSLKSGNYKVIVSDINGCTDSLVFELSNPAKDIDITINEILPTCPTSNDGTLSVTTNGTQTPYSFEWRDSTTNTLLSSNQTLLAGRGIYKLSITNGNNCTIDTIVAMTTSATIISIATLGTTGVTCFNKCDGSASFQALTNGNPSGTYRYFIDGKEESNQASILIAENLCSGTHQIYALDNTCQSDTFEFTVMGRDTVSIDTINTIVTNPKCFGGSDGAIELAVKGIPNGAAKVTWIDQGVDGERLSNISAGTYYADIEFGTLCRIRDSIRVNTPEELISTVDEQNSNGINCKDPNSGKIQLVTSGGVRDYTYAWSPSISTDSVATQLTANTYNIIVTDANGCSTEVTKAISSAVPITATIPSPPEPNCHGEQTCVEVLNPSGGIGNNYKFSLNNGPLMTPGSCVPIFAGEYLVSVFDSIGCSYDTTIVVGQPAELKVDAGPDQKIVIGQSSEPISVQPVYQFAIDSFIWSPTDKLEFQTEDQQIAVASPLETTLYTITVVDPAGCKTSDQVLIEVDKRRNVYNANIFSPNGDSVNDRFKLVTGSGVEKVISFKIFDRWGNCVYTENPTNNPIQGWDGMIGGEPALPNVYVYVAEVAFIDGKTIMYRGDITLVR